MSDEDEDDSSTENTTLYLTTPYYVPRRPQVVHMRDLSPDTRHQLTREYFDTYDPWTGIRIAATLGVLISLFVLFLLYKSRFHRPRKGPELPPKRTSLYLYDEDLGSRSSLGSIYGLYKDPVGGFQLEEVVVKSSMVAVKVHHSGKRNSKSGGPKYGTLRITEDASKSLPCSPYKLEDEPEQPPQVVVDNASASTSLVGSIASFGSADPPLEVVVSKDNADKPPKHIHKTHHKHHTKEVVVTTKKPQDYRSRSTVVSIARRLRPS